MRNNLAMKTSREETSTTNDRGDAARTLGLGLGQHTMAENEDNREGDKDRPEVAQVMVSGSPEAAAHGGGGAGTGETAAARQGRSCAVRAELRVGRRSAGHRRRRRGQGAAVSVGERRWRDSRRLRAGRRRNREARSKGAVGLKKNKPATKINI
jgi:hypothetical protein